MNKIVLIIVVIVFLGIGGYFLLGGGYQYQVPTSTSEVDKETIIALDEASISDVKEIIVIGTEFAFHPSSIEVSAGEKVKIVFRNEGKFIHNLLIEGLGVGTKTITSGAVDDIEFTAPLAGVYNLYCSVSGHREAGMEGEFISQQ